MFLFFRDGWPSEVTLSIVATAIDATGENASSWEHSGDAFSYDSLDWLIGGILIEALNFEEAKRNGDAKAMKLATKNMDGFVLELKREQGMSPGKRFGKAR